MGFRARSHGSVRELPRVQRRNRACKDEIAREISSAAVCVAKKGKKVISFSSYLNSAAYAMSILYLFLSTFFFYLVNVLKLLLQHSYFHLHVLFLHRVLFFFFLFWFSRSNAMLIYMPMGLMAAYRKKVINSYK